MQKKKLREQVCICINVQRKRAFELPWTKKNKTQLLYSS